LRHLDEVVVLANSQYGLVERLPNQLDGSLQVVIAIPQWIWWLPQYRLDSLQVLTGTPAVDIATMTLDVYNARGVPILPY
jgi:hypothetical protein